MYGVFANEKSRTLWVCFRHFCASTTQVPSELKAFDLQSGTLKASCPLPTKYAFCNDIGIIEDGTAYISDTNNMEVD
jgi:hypothetical protein